MSDPVVNIVGQKIVKPIAMGLFLMEWEPDVKSPMAPFGVIGCDAGVVESGDMEGLQWHDASGPLTKIMPVVESSDMTYTFSLYGKEWTVTFVPDISEADVLTRVAKFSEFGEDEGDFDHWATANQWYLTDRFGSHSAY